MVRLENIFKDLIIDYKVKGARRVQLKIKGLYNKHYLIDKLNGTFEISGYIVNKVKWNFVNRTTKIDIKLTNLDKKFIFNNEKVVK